MKRTIKTVICLLLSLASVLLCIPIGMAQNAADTVEKGIPLTVSDTAAFNVVAEKGNYRLAYCVDTGAVRVENLNGEVLYNSAVTPDVYDTSTSTDTFVAYMNSLLAITYSKSDDRSGNFIKDYSSLADNIRDVSVLSDGIRVTVKFDAPEISMSLEIRLTDDGLKLKIPQDSIREDSDYLLYSVEVLPFFGAAAQTDDGYLLYPDGSGAITEFSKAMNKSRFTDELVLDVYSPHDDEEIMDEDTRKVMLPVYGIKRNETAFVACADSREENVSIHVSPATSMALLPVNRSYFEFKYRGQYRIYISNSVKANQDKDTLQYRLKLDSEMIEEDLEMSIMFLGTEDADYSGMANKYREHLIENGALNEERVDDAQKLSLDIYMSVSDPDSFAGGKIVATDMQQAQSIIEAYLDKTQSLNVRLLGWSSDGGMLPQKAKIESSVGGQKGLKALNALAEENADKLKLLLQANPVLTSKMNSATLMGNLIPISDDDKETFLITPNKAVTELNKYEKLIRKLTSVSLAVDSIGQTVYNDYKNSRRHNRTDTVDDWTESLSSDAVTAAQGGNLYTLSKVDYLYDIPTESSGYPLTDYSVPFYQMVVHGHISYSAQCPGNLSSDVTNELLKWIEYGCVPYFLLTAEDPTILSRTDANTIFSSQNSQWQTMVLEIYDRYSKELSGLSDNHITEHTRVSDTLAAVTYDDETVIVINYGDTATTYQGIQVNAKDYAVKGD